MSHRVILVKIIPKGYAADFLNGNLYLNTNQYFGMIDQSDIVRYDPHDGIDESKQVASVEVQDEGGAWLPIPTVGPISVRNKLSKFLNILCLYTITDRPGDEFDELNLKFGDIAIIINDLSEFVRRLLIAAQIANKRVSYGPVEYVDRNSHDGTMGPFKKFSNLQYQNEFRFVFDKGDGEACRLSAGNLRDITHVIASSSITLFRKKMLTT